MKSNAGIVIKRLQEKLKQKVSELPEIIGNEGQRAFADEFKNQRWDNNKWKEVKRRMPGTFEYKYPKRKGLSRRTNPILVGRTRRLKRAVETSYKKRNSNKLVWAIYGEVGKYAAVHNFGEKGMPQRQFMGINNRIRKRILEKAAKAMKL